MVFLIHTELRCAVNHTSDLLQLEVGYGAVGTAGSKLVLSVKSGKKPFMHQGDRFMPYLPHRTSSSHMECMCKRKVEGQERFRVTVKVRHTEKE